MHAQSCSETTANAANNVHDSFMGIRKEDRNVDSVCRSAVKGVGSVKEGKCHRKQGMKIKVGVVNNSKSENDFLASAVRLTCTVKLPPYTEVFCVARHDKPMTGPAVFESEAIAPHEVLLARVLTDTTESRSVPLRLLNPTGEILPIAKRTVVGRMVAADRDPLWRVEGEGVQGVVAATNVCLLYTSPSPRD